ncbi:MAG: phosphate transport system permease protein [Pseudonocardiales bacterium]|nr:phosphate transport system permease protein [Pseudonocardiales bacterium]
MSVTFRPESKDVPMSKQEIAADVPTQPTAAVAAQEAPEQQQQAQGPDGPPDVPRVLRARTTDDILSLVGSAVAAVAFTWIVYEHVLAWSGILGFVVCTWVVFLAFYSAVSVMENPRPVLLDRLAAAVVTSGAALVGLALLSTVWYVYYKGWPALHHWNFFTKDMSGVRPTAPLDQGGCWHAIVGSGIQIGMAIVISLPLGIGTAVYLTEVGGRMSGTVRTVVEAMTAIPDILAGLFIYALLIIALHWERSGFAVSLALAVTMTPIIARSAEVVLRVVPGGLREAGLALGASRWQTVIRVVLPTARTGLATSLILGIARIAGETAPLLIVSGANTFFNRDPFHNPMNSLPLYVYTAVRSGEPLFIARGYGAAALLLTLVLALFITTRFLARDKIRAR